ncbi:MAG TPA: acyltransferase [Lentisphaeria bacterium]|nr:acyltransferase [Lentisphaeria bacterium]
MQGIKAAAIQFTHAPGDKAFNLGRIRSFVKEAAAQGVDLIVFPEMCITGYWHVRKLARAEIESLAEPVPAGLSTQELLTLAAANNMTIGAGLIEITDAGELYNTYVVAMPDGRVESHRKIHCFISEHMKSGDAYTVFDIPQGARVGVLICYDNNIGENVRITALKGAEILLAPHQTGGCNSPSPRCMGKIDPQLWENRDRDAAAIEAEFRGPKGREWLMHWLPARAHDNGLFLVYSNGVGVDDDEVRTGNAMILDPYGDILSETWAPRDAMVVADLDPDRLDMCTGQRWLTTRRPELYGPLIERSGKEKDTRTVRFARQQSAGQDPSGQQEARADGGDAAGS